MSNNYGRHAKTQTRAIAAWIEQGNYVNLDAILGPAADTLEMIEAAIEADRKPSRPRLEKAARELREGFERLWGVNGNGPVPFYGFERPRRVRTPFGAWSDH